jgi:hypothetical protein
VARDHSGESRLAAVVAATGEPIEQLRVAQSGVRAAVEKLSELLRQ